MSKVGRALVVSAVATGTAVAVWKMVERWRDRTVQLAGGRANTNIDRPRSRMDEIEALTQQQKDLMLRELSDQL